MFGKFSQGKIVSCDRPLWRRQRLDWGYQQFIGPIGHLWARLFSLVMTKNQALRWTTSNDQTTIMITVGEDYIVWELDERQKTAAHNHKSHCLFPSWGVSGHEQHRMHGQHNCKMQQLPTISRLILLMNQSAQFCCSYNFNKGAGRRGYRERVHHCTTNCFLPKMQIIVFAKDWNLFVLIASWRRANMPYLFFSKLSLCFISPPPTHCFCLGLLAIHQVSKRKLFRID